MLSRPVRTLSSFGPALLILAFGLVFFVSLSRDEALRGELARAHQARGETDRVLQRLLEVETAQRAFLVTGDELHLAPLPAAPAEIGRSFSRLRSVFPAGAFRARLDSLQRAVLQRMSLVQENVARRRQGPLGADEFERRLARGKLAMDEVRRRSAALMQLQEAGLQARMEAQRRDARSTRLFLVLGVLVAAALSTITSRSFERVALRLESDAERLRQANEAQRLHGEQMDNAHEELQVQAMELEEANQVLQQQAVELEEANEKLADQAVELELQAEDLSVQVSEIEASRRVLLEREARFRTLIENSSDLISVLSPEGVMQFESPAILGILGYSADELLGARVFDFIHPDDVAQVQEVFAQASAQPGNHGTVEFRFRNARGEWRYMESMVQNLVHDPHIAGIVANSRDITERRAAERELEQAHAQLVQAQKMDAVGRLAAGVAHDFNNLLTVILGSAELLQMELPPEHTAAEDAEQILAAARRAADLTRQLLAFSRKQELRTVAFGVNELVSQLAMMLERLLGETFTLEVELSPTTGRARGDPGQLEQVITNLVVNARDAMPEGGTVTVCTGRTRLNEGGLNGFDVAPGEFICIEVRDRGTGMAPEVLERIWEPFFTTKEADRGTGLGLSTVYGILKQSGGAVEVESQLGKGTLVRAYLPAALADDEAEGSYRGREVAVRRRLAQAADGS